MRKHCGNCENYRKETKQFSEECGKCVSARLENGEMTDPSHWRGKTQTNADRIRSMSDEEIAKIFTSAVSDGCPPKMDWDCAKDEYGWDACDACWCKWLQQPAEGE